ncbi:MAG: hypothetical protein ACJA2R_000519 [Saprospiraceae bacterium]|jgi:hypothetical protein
MQLNAITCNLITKKTDCLVLIVGNQLHDNTAESLNSDNSYAARFTSTAIGGLISQLQKSGDIKKTLSSSIVINNPDGLQANRLLIFSRGEAEALDEQMFAKLAKSIGSKLASLPIKDAVISLASSKTCAKFR